MPPEKLTKSFVPNEKSDIYSLGVCLYEHFFGIHPYLGSDNRPNNYQEYKKRLEKAELLPTSKMIKKVQRCSLKF